MSYKQKKFYYLYLKSESLNEFLYVMKWLFLGVFLLLTGVYSVVLLGNFFKSKILLELIYVFLPLCGAGLHHLLLNAFEFHEKPRLNKYSRLQRYKIKRFIKIQRKTNSAFYLFCFSMTIISTLWFF